MIPYDDFSLLIEDVLADVTRLLAERRSGVEGAHTETQLVAIQHELEGLAAQVKARDLPPPGQRYLAAAYIATDAWPPDDRLGERICTLEFVYRRQLD